MGPIQLSVARGCGGGSPEAGEILGLSPGEFSLDSYACTSLRVLKTLYKFSLFVKHGHTIPPSPFTAFKAARNFPPPTPGFPRIHNNPPCTYISSPSHHRKREDQHDRARRARAGGGSRRGPVEDDAIHHAEEVQEHQVPLIARQGLQPRFSRNSNADTQPSCPGNR